MKQKKARTTYLLMTLVTFMSFGLTLLSPVNPVQAAGNGDKLRRVVLPPLMQSYERPLVTVVSYTPSESPIIPGQDFSVRVKLRNSGQLTANNVVAVFTNSEIITRDNGGVVAVGQINAGGEASFRQNLTATWEIWGLTTASIALALSYSDDAGTIYTENFNLNFEANTPYRVTPTYTPSPTPTPGVAFRPQMVVTSYSTNPDLLQPGNRFTLTLEIQNQGSDNAEQVTLIVGGGSSSSGGENGTPVPGGTSGGSGEFTNFAPLGSSNIQTLGDVPASEALSAQQEMIVNVTTAPGAYSMRLSFAYQNDKGINFNDDQVITLLVFYPPVVEVNFYRQPDVFYAGQPGLLPLQIVNLGKNSVVFGNMSVTATGAQLTNNVILVGRLDSGGFYPLDASIVPDAPGSLELNITVDYTDDFNQPQVLEKNLTIEVLEGGFETPGGEVSPGEGQEGIPGEFPPIQPETFWQKLWRFIRGLLGLDSGLPEIQPGIETPIPSEEIKPGGGPIVVPPKG
jgi:hypothetical protein